MKHTATGFWLEEAGPVEAVPPLDGDVDADVVVLGGGYTGHVDGVAAAAARARGARRAARGGRLRARAERPQRRLRRDAVDEPARPGRPLRHRARAGRRRGVERERRGDRRVVRGRGRRRLVPPGRVPARVGGRGAGRGARPAIEAGSGRLGPRPRRRALVPLDDASRRGAPRPPSAARCSRPTTPPCSRRGSRSGCGAGCSSGACGSSSTRACGRCGSVPTSSPRRPAGACAPAAVLALNAATRGVRPLRARLAVTSSHIVLTEPVPDVLERIGWTGGESITDGRTFVHYFRTTPDGRIAFGWGGGPLAFGARKGGRVERSPGHRRHHRRASARAVPGARGPRLTHAWGGPIDVSRATCRRSARCPTARCTTRSASPATGSGRRIWRGGSCPGSRSTRATRTRGSRSSIRRRAAVPPEPLAWVGGSLVRAAFLRRERIEASGGRPDPLTRAVTAAPKALGIHVGR